jgi:hypothetical protein
MNPIKLLNRKLAHIFAFCSIVTLWFLPSSSELVCLENGCNSISLANISDSGNLVQTFDIRFRVSPNSNQDYAGDFRDPDKGVGLSWNQEQRLLITVPMRHGTNSAFGYTTPKGLIFSEVRVRVVKSTSISLFIDEKIAYSHRYENAPFFINPRLPISTTDQAGDVDFTQTDFKIEIEKKSNPILRLVSITFVLAYFGFITLRSLRRFFPVHEKNLNGKKVLQLRLYGLVGMSWAFSLLAWFRNPIDSTGGNNPGPFGPIGAAFSDFYQLSQVAQFNRPYDLGGTNYPPAGILFLRIISRWDPNDLSFFPIAGIILGTVFFLFSDSFEKKHNSMIFLGSFPLIFGIVRGNLDVLAIFLVWISVLAWKKEKFVSTGILLAFAISLKVWPVIFLALYFKKKSYKSVVSTLIVGLSITLVSSFILGYSNLIDIVRISSIALFDQSKLGTYAFQNSFSAAALLFIGHILMVSRNPFDVSQVDIDTSLAFVNGSYAAIITFVLLATFIYFFFKAKTVSIEFLILCGIALCIPTQSFTYRGLIILLFFYLRCQEKHKPKKSNFRKQSKLLKDVTSTTDFQNKIASYAAVPLFAPVAFYFVPGTQFSTASLLQPLGLLTFIGLMIFQEKDESISTYPAPVTP